MGDDGKEAGRDGLALGIRRGRMDTFIVSRPCFPHVHIDLIARNASAMHDIVFALTLQPSMRLDASVFRENDR